MPPLPYSGPLAILNKQTASIQPAPHPLQSPSGRLLPGYGRSSISDLLSKKSSPLAICVLVLLVLVPLWERRSRVGMRERKLNPYKFADADAVAVASFSIETRPKARLPQETVFTAVETLSIRWTIG